MGIIGASSLTILHLKSFHLSLNAGKEIRENMQIIRERSGKNQRNLCSNFGRDPVSGIQVNQIVNVCMVNCLIFSICYFWLHRI